MHDCSSTQCVQLPLIEIGTENLRLVVILTTLGFAITTFVVLHVQFMVLFRESSPEVITSFISLYEHERT